MRHGGPSDEPELDPALVDVLVLDGIDDVGERRHALGDELRVGAGIVSAVVEAVICEC